MLTKNIIFAHSGGVTSVLNTTASGLISRAKQKNVNTLIAKNGILGLLENKLYRSDNLNEHDLTKLRQTPSSVFGSCRYKLPHHHEDPQLWQTLFQNCQEHNIDAIIYQGGNDSQDTSLKIMQAAAAYQYPITCYGIPKTIDNDLYGTDFSPGFPSCAKYLATSIQEASLDTQAMSRSSTKVFIMEVMGRHTGWLAMASALAAKTSAQGPHIILTPERPVDISNWLAYTKATVARYGHCVIVASEGIIDQSTQQRLCTNSTTDAFGHQKLGGVAAQLAQLVETQLQFKTHYAIPDYLQRSAGHLRSEVDDRIAWQLGQEAIDLYLKNTASCLLGLSRTKDDWQITPTSLAICANKEKKLPDNFYSDNAMHISATGRAYFLPLIQGEVYPNYQHGLPDYFDNSKLQLLNKVSA